MLKPVLHAVQMFLKGATGKDRQANMHLSEQLLTVQVAYDHLQQSFDQLQGDHNKLQKNHQDLAKQLSRHSSEIDEIVAMADRDAQLLSQENEDLQHRLWQSETEKEALQETNAHLLGKLSVLEQELSLRNYQSGDQNIAQNSSETDTSQASFSATGVIQLPDDFDLSEVSLALIGGHETTYREVKAELQQYGLKRCVHIPPHSIASSSRNKIKDKISQCDLIITITSYVDHSVSKCVKQLKDTQMLAGECLRVSCHGKSGLVREVLNYFQDPLSTSEAA